MMLSSIAQAMDSVTAEKIRALLFRLRDVGQRADMYRERAERLERENDTSRRSGQTVPAGPRHSLSKSGGDRSEPWRGVTFVCLRT